MSQNLTAGSFLKPVLCVGLLGFCLCSSSGVPKRIQCFRNLDLFSFMGARFVEAPVQLGPMELLSILGPKTKPKIQVILYVTFSQNFVDKNQISLPCM